MTPKVIPRAREVYSISLGSCCVVKTQQQLPNDICTSLESMVCCCCVLTTQQHTILSIV